MSAFSEMQHKLPCFIVTIEDTGVTAVSAIDFSLHWPNKNKTQTKTNNKAQKKNQHQKTPLSKGFFQIK